MKIMFSAVFAVPEIVVVGGGGVVVHPGDGERLQVAAPMQRLQQGLLRKWPNVQANDETLKTIKVK